ncbi:MAG: DNA polymerase III subunit beta [Syntrophales bacterium]|jgi:DNA polymerase-3 subunit beta|nr:DNA polymerase III subunit beta [Syntrophales bacterium]MCK9527177.1 DNA polymerase III subunit beta [Syntrophales bacterium]MDX9921698.1 DNA polymerase III subunit beta [Syntrophales bacterium]
MEFTVDRHVFQEAVQRTLGIVERKTTIQILNNILIKAGDSMIRIVATDREIGLVADYEARILSGGEITLNAKKLHEMVREMDGDTVFFKTTENHQAHIVSGNAEYRMSGISAEEFPEVRLEDDVSFFTLPAKFLRNMILQTFYAASADENRSSLNGAFFKKEGKTCEMVATDGHRLALVRRDIPSDHERIDDDSTVEGVIIPRKGLNEIRKMVEDGEGTGTVDVGIRNHVCVVRQQGSMLRVSLVDAQYPDYRRVIPKDRGVSVRIEKKKMMQSLRRMAVMSTEHFSGVVITLRDGSMKLNSTNPDLGEANEELDVDFKNGTFSVGYNIRYLIESIEGIDSDVVTFEMRSTGGPGVVRIPDDETYLGIIMPITIQGK